MRSEASLEEAFGLALKLHRAGGLDDAGVLYDRILAVAPEHLDALHFKGVLAHQRGDSEAAIALIRRSVAIDGRLPDRHNNLGNVLLETGRVDEAAEAYENAVRLDPERADVYNNLGVLRREQHRPIEAEAAYRRSLALEPRSADALTNLGSLLNAQDRSEEALACYCEALLLKPGHGTARRALGFAYYTLGRIDEAVEVYRQWLADEPHNPEARHHLAACSGESVPQRASDAYVESVFDGFADSFDAKLAHLHYRAPELLAQSIAEHLGEVEQRSLDVLDAGCGTGLCGPLLAPCARRLEGVDLSERMLARARTRRCYDRLAKTELTAFLEQAPPASYDLIASADTLCYFGDLAPVLHAAAKALRPDGWMFFTVEALGDASSGEADFRLQPHGRYSHGASYLRRVLADAGLKPISLQAAHLRIEGGKPVEGQVVAARKTGDC
ncbi:Predicted methyltransferase, contains TPR repeat [Burkholderiales bacterium 8X]|nr:Predicted methyltransferase, contains TPR repeat [Burkholderiales bacterium 8X]